MTDVARPVREIIDVDLLDDNELAAANAQFRRLRRHLSSHAIHASGPAGPSHSREPIIVLDSDEEVEAAVSTPRRRRAVLRSPPPAPRGISPIPPVPPLRTHRITHRTSHRSSNRPAAASPVIIPNDRPYAFEANLGQSSRRHRSPPLNAGPAPRASSRSHHQPSMGLGGAIISMARGQAREARRRQQQPPPPAHSSFFGSFAGYISNRLGFFASRNLLEDLPLPYAPRAQVGETDWDAWPYLNPQLDLYGLGAAPKPAEPMYKSSYTHPAKLQPEFTSDFQPEEKKPDIISGSGTSGCDAIVISDDDDDELMGLGSASVEATESAVPSILVCAKCVDPLVLDSSGVCGITEEEKKNLRVWGLRCGHMLDGRCIHSIMRPPVPSLGDKRKADDELDASPSKRRHTRDSKWKGKGVALDSWEDPSIGHESPRFNGSMRSRLRPRHSRSDDHDQADHRPRHPLPTGPRRSKGKGRARKPVVLERHDWICPVSGCGRVHRSVRMSDADETVLGGWSMDPEQGAIALFV
ncbi:hypothetical protein QCA50_006060 [Cerrena zonata]|uniref:Uncharacterized protein n=1 Tax=Cerrena zonata TaxID=2478898 RepID=A0AAW0GLZ9_9APHY